MHLLERVYAEKISQFKSMMYIQSKIFNQGQIRNAKNYMKLQKDSLQKMNKFSLFSMKRLINLKNL